MKLFLSIKKNCIIVKFPIFRYLIEVSLKTLVVENLNETIIYRMADYADGFDKNRFDTD